MEMDNVEREREYKIKAKKTYRLSFKSFKTEDDFDGVLAIVHMNGNGPTFIGAAIHPEEEDGYDYRMGQRIALNRVVKQLIVYNSEIDEGAEKEVARWMWHEYRRQKWERDLTAHGMKAEDEQDHVPEVIKAFATVVEALNNWLKKGVLKEE